MASKGMKALFGWCKLHTQGYRDVNVTNMTTSWADGLAFCALLHRFRPDLIDFDSLSKGNAFYNNDLAFSVAEKELNIAALLDAEDMANMRSPDKLSVMTYLAQYYNCFRNCNPADAPTPDTPVLNANHASPRKSNGGVKSENDEGDESMCAICGKHVHLVQRYFEKGKLYHRTCHRNDSLEKLRSKKFFRPPENEKNTDLDGIDNHGNLHEKKNKHPRLQEPPETGLKPDEQPSPIASDRKEPLGYDQPVTLTVPEEMKTDQLVSPKPRARPVKQGSNLPDDSKTHPVAQPRSRGSSNVTKRSKPDEKPPTVTSKKILNPFEMSGSDSDTTLSSSSSEDDESSSPFVNTPPARPSPVKHSKETEEARKPVEKPIEGITEEGPEENESLNPFGDAEEDGEEKGTAEAEPEPQEEESKNPFGDVDSDEEEGGNPFGDDDFEDEEEVAPDKSRDSAEFEGANPFGEYDAKSPPARPPPPKSRLKERFNPFTDDDDVTGVFVQESNTNQIKKKKRPAPVPPKASSPPPPRPPAWKGSPVKIQMRCEITKAAERKMQEINRANATDPKFARTQLKKPAPSPPQPKPPVTAERKNAPLPPKPKSPAKTEGRIPNPSKPDKNKEKTKAPAKQLRSNRAAPGYGFPLIKRKVERKMSEETIANELQVLDMQLSDLEVKGVKLEEMLRFTMDKEMDWTVEEDELLQEWFELVNKKNILLRRESELVFLMQQQKLEEEHADIEFQLRKLFNKPDNSKTDQDKLEEEKLLQRLLEVVESRNIIINSIEEERLKEAEEDSAYEKMKKLQENPNKKKKKNKVKKIFSKRSKKQRQQAEAKEEAKT